MRLKTFLATYLLFLCILFSSLCIVSIYLTNSQINMLKDKSAAEYQTIAASLAKDIAVLSGRNVNFSRDVDTLVNGYAKYYKKNNITIELSDLSLTSQKNSNAADSWLSFINRGREHFIFISAALSEPFQYYRLDYYCNISNSIADMRNIQRLLLVVCIAFSVITAIILYFILSSVFKPLGVIAIISRKIANGQYGERIHVNGNNELSSMAGDFNRMAEEIERQIRLLEEESVQKQRFVENFAHEIRTPLTSVYGYAEYIQKAFLDENEIIESAQCIMDEASHMKKVANSLLELATLRQYTPMKNEISIQRMFENINQTMRESLKAHHIKLVCHSDAGVLEGQEDLIMSLLQNLIHNALKSCSPDTGVVHLEADTHGKTIVLSVSDNGCGIPEECISKVTEPFYRVDKARTREQGGAGLGLALCKRIAEAHNAEMSLKSSVGVGTTVKIIFTTS